MVYVKDMDEKKYGPYRLYNPQIKAETSVFAILLKWPAKGQLKLGAPRANANTTAHLLGHNHLLPVSPQPDGVKISLAEVDWTELHSTDAWVIRLQFLDNDSTDPTETLLNTAAHV